MIKLFVIIGAIISFSFLRITSTQNIEEEEIDYIYCYDLPEVVVTPNIILNKKEIVLLARLINSEAGREPFKGMLAVGNVVVNRSQRNKQSINTIIYQKGQFDGIKTKQFKVYSKNCYKAAKLSLLGVRVIPSTVEYFYNPVTSTDKKWIRKLSKQKFSKIGNHVFCHRQIYKYQIPDSPIVKIDSFITFNPIISVMK